MTERETDFFDKNIKLKSQYFWDINDTKIQGFKNNFSCFDAEVGYILLDMLIYYNSTHCYELTNAAIQELKRQIWLKGLKKGISFNSSYEISKYIRLVLDDSYIFPVSNIDESGSSSEVLESYYRSSKDFVPLDNYKSLNSLLEVIATGKPKSIIFVDDIIGTGKQFDNFFSKTKHFCGDATIKKCLETNPQIEFFYLVYAADEEGLSFIKQSYNNLSVISVEIFKAEDRITNKNNEYWEIYDRYEYFMKQLEDIALQYPRKCKFSLDLPILYVTGRAQNTSFEYYWNDYNNKWNILKER